MVLTDFPGLLLWGVPGLVVWVVGQTMVFVAAWWHHKRSPNGLRLTMMGLGLLIAGWGVGLALAAVARGAWPVVAVALVLAWPSVVLFRWSGRVSLDP
jgi:hypothetical protein